MVVMFSAGKAQQLIQGLAATGDEGRQISAVIELCQVSQLIVLGYFFCLCEQL